MITCVLFERGIGTQSKGLASIEYTSFYELLAEGKFKMK